VGSAYRLFLVGVSGLAGSIVLAAVNIAIFIYEWVFARETFMKPDAGEFLSAQSAS